MPPRLKGRTILVARPPDSRDGLVQGLRRAGARVVEAPLVRIGPPLSYKGLDKALRRLDAYDAVLFASVNAVEAFFGRARVLGLRPARPSVLYAVGPSTAHRLSARGWKGARLPPEYLGKSLAQALGNVAGLRILLPRAREAREELPALLRKAGAQVDAVEAYRIVPNPEGVRALGMPLTRIDAVAFTSGSQVRALAACLGRRGFKRLFLRAAAAAIGPVTASALTERGVHPEIVPSRAGLAALCRSLVQQLRRVP